MITICGNKKSFYQWDIDQRLVLTDVGVGTEIHFCNSVSKDTECLSVYAYEDNGAIYADVPNVILQIAGRFKVYVWPFHTTQYEEFTVISRPKPADYIYTEVEIHNIESVVNKVFEKEKEELAKEIKTSVMGDIGTEIDNLKQDFSEIVSEKVTTGADMENHPFDSGCVVAEIYPTNGNGEIFIPIGWKAIIRYIIDPLTETAETVSAVDSDITKKITFSEEQYILIYISRLDGLSLDKNDCPVTITQSKSRIDDIEEQMGDIDKAFDELHAYAEALISGGVAE